MDGYISDAADAHAENRVETAGASTSDSGAMPSSLREHPVAMDDGSAMVLTMEGHGDMPVSQLSFAESPANGVGAIVQDIRMSDGGGDLVPSGASPVRDESVQAEAKDGGIAAMYLPLEDIVASAISVVSSSTAVTTKPILTFTEPLLLPAEFASNTSTASLSTANGSAPSVVFDSDNTVQTVTVEPASGTEHPSPGTALLMSLAASSQEQQPPSGSVDEVAAQRGESSRSSAKTNGNSLEAHAMTLGSSVPVAVQTVVLSSNGSQQPAIVVGSNTGVASSAFQPSITSRWILGHFQARDNVSLPRHTMFVLYIEYCKQNGASPVNSASFGKVVRQVFPGVRTRRLGTRGRSRYHYYGVSVRPESPYCSTMEQATKKQMSDESLTPVTGSPEDEAPVDNSFTETFPAPNSDSSNNSSMNVVAASSNTGLPGFPDIAGMRLPCDIPTDKVTLLLVLYRAHCYRILDAIQATNFMEVERYIEHFWGGLPENLHELLGHSVVVDIVGVCDFVLYKAILQSVVPAVLQPLSLDLTHAIRTFAKVVSGWIASALENFPDAIRERKIEIVKLFTTALRRRTSVSHLTQATQSVLESSESVMQMLVDWQQLDLSSIVYQSLSSSRDSDDAVGDGGKRCVRLHLEFMAEFEDLIQQQANVESFVHWLGTIVTRVVTETNQESTEDRKIFCSLSCQFLLRWQLFTSCIVRDLTLHSAASFGSYHLLSMLFEDYLLFLLESEISELRERELQMHLNLYMLPDATSVTAGPEASDVALSAASTCASTSIEDLCSSTSTGEAEWSCTALLNSASAPPTGAHHPEIISEILRASEPSADNANDFDLHPAKRQLLDVIDTASSDVHVVELSLPLDQMPAEEVGTNGFCITEDGISVTANDDPSSACHALLAANNGHSFSGNGTPSNSVAMGTTNDLNEAHMLQDVDVETEVVLNGQ